MDGFTPLLSSIGGILIGLAAVGLLYTNGRIAGISGIIAGVLHPEPDNTQWRILFIAGMLFGALLILWLFPMALAVHIDVPTAVIVLGGFLVGLGTRISNGCTSGHGVCGVGRLAPRSIVASASFFIMAMISAYVIRHGIGYL